MQRLARIGELTAAGLNLESAKVVMDLEDEVQRLGDEVARVRRETREVVERVHRQYPARVHAPSSPVTSR
jgi:DNA-binding transcriptional MerR regulator